MIVRAKYIGVPNDKVFDGEIYYINIGLDYVTLNYFVTGVFADRNPSFEYSSSKIFAANWQIISATDDVSEKTIIPLLPTANVIKTGENDQISKGLSLVSQERFKQILKLGYSIKNDAIGHNKGELLKAARAYLFDPSQRWFNNPPVVWPWGKSFWKPTPDNRIKELTKAAALIIAEIDRLLYESETIKEG